MPLKPYIDGTLVLRCVNYHGPDYENPVVAAGQQVSLPQTTMEALPDAGIVPGLVLDPEGDARWAELQAIVANMPANRGKKQEPEPPRGTTRQMRPSRGVAVQLYVCRVCGYVEMYAERPRKSEASGG